MAEHVEVSTVEDGGNPRTPLDIGRVEGGFTIRPFSEDDDGNYRFRLNVQVRNDARTPVPVRFTIEWGDTEHQVHRRYVLLSQGDDQWERFPAEIQGTKASATVSVPPGTSYLCMHPRYEHARFLELIRSLPPERFRIQVIGKSRRGRDVFAVEIGKAGARPLAVMSRVHPYETIGSFFVEGMLHWLRDGKDARSLLERHRLLFIPMPNPDGVAEGTCKLTLGGLNFSANCAATTEPEGTALREYLLREKPVALFDFHGWMYDNDNFVTNDTVRGRKLYAALMDRPELFSKGIEIRYRDYPTVGGQKNIGGLLADSFGAVFYNGSWSWYGRSASDLRAMGCRLLDSYAALFG